VAEGLKREQLREQRGCVRGLQGPANTRSGPTRRSGAAS
jgi:hypothetical protein